MLTPRLILALLTSALAVGCSVEETIQHRRATSGAPDMTSGTDAPSAAFIIPGKLTVDGAVHTGKYESGTPFVGIEGEVVSYDPSATATNNLLALAHAQMLSRYLDLDLDAASILSVAVITDKLSCSPTCFSLNESTHLTELSKYSGDRFAGVPSEKLADSFAISTLLFVHGAQLSIALSHRVIANPDDVLSRHPDPFAWMEHTLIAHLWSPFWRGFEDVFRECEAAPWRECITELTGYSYYMSVKLDAHANVTRALRATAPHELVVSRAELIDYAREISALYPEVDLDLVATRLDGVDEPIMGAALSALITELLIEPVELATTPEIVFTLCTQSIITDQDVCDAASNF